MGSPREAEHLLVSNIDFSNERLIVGVLDGYLALARIKQSQGDARSALDALEQAQRIASRTGATELDDWIVTTAQARQWIAQGDLDAAADWARRRGLVDNPASGAPDASHEGALYPLYESDYLALAELWLAQDKPGEALDVLAELLDRSRALRRTDATVKVLILMALAHQQLQRPEQGLAALTQALALAQPGGYVRTFVDHGPRMANLLYQALAQGTAVDYVQQLLAALPPSTGCPMLVEPFSERELQVLRLLSASLSSAEIGEKLYISANTVRFHLKNIYSKLNVHTREDAVQQARTRHLL